MNKILIGILCIDRPKTQEKCLKQLFMHTDRSQYNLVVIDNNSNAETKEVLEKYKKEIDVIIHNEFNVGCAFGVNEYMALRLPGQHVLDINADAHILVDDWLPLMLKVIAAPDIGIASGKRPDLFYDAGRWEYYKQNFEILERDGVYLEWDRVHNSIIYPWAMMSSSLIDEIGYMSEDLGIDDVEYSYRVKSVGKKCVYIPNVVILQPHGEEPQNHPEYAANRELVMKNWSEYQLRVQNPGVYPVYRGSRFIPGSITDERYQVRSDANYEFFKNYKRNHNNGLE